MLLRVLLHAVQLSESVLVQLTYTQDLVLVQLHGTCLGFEALAIIVSGDMKILSSFDSYDNASPLVLTEDGQSGSAFFGSLPRELLQAVQEEPLAMENHGRGPCLQLPSPHLKTKFTCQCMPLVLTKDSQSGSALFGSLPRELLQAMQEEPFVMENHWKVGICSDLFFTTVCFKNTLT